MTQQGVSSGCTDTNMWWAWCAVGVPTCGGRGVQWVYQHVVCVVCGGCTNMWCVWCVVGVPTCGGCGGWWVYQHLVGVVCGGFTNM